MGRMKGYVLFMMVLIVGAIALWGCPKKADVGSAQEGLPPVAGPEGDRTTETKSPGTEQGTAAEGAGVVERASASGAGLRPIYFDYDRSGIRSDAQTVLRSNAAWLKTHPDVKVRIEGNCDVRGTVEYNQALGQRRAKSAKQYLTDLGVDASRISLLSYGKERPFCRESTEACWQLNRRGDFVMSE
jgi:peptidoglycan-associated lipoprotein